MLNKKAAVGVLFFVFALLYIATMVPTIWTMDNGELITDACKLTIAHPTGYPLFCILGKISTVVIPFGSPAWRVNAMNAILAAFAVAVLFLAVCEVTRKRNAAFAAVLFGVSPVFWETASAAEVHALAALLITTELFLFLRWRRLRDNRILLWLAFTAGLSAANHLSSVLILPGLVYGVLQSDRSILPNRSVIVKSVLLFLLPLTLYAYLPLRAEASRGTLWGDIYAASGFIAHVTGRAFKVRMFSLTAPEIWWNFKLFLQLILKQFPIYLAWVLPIGAVVIRRKMRGLGLALFLMAILNVIYNINYAIPDIAPYYMPVFIILSVLAAVGLAAVIDSVRLPAARKPALPLLAAVLVSIAALQYPVMDRHEAYLVEDYANNVLQTVEKDSLLITCGDSQYNGLAYARKVEGKRPDVVLLERNILNAWMPGSKKWTARCYYESISEPSKAMQRFRGGAGYSKADMRSEKLLTDIVSAVAHERPVYITCSESHKSHPIFKRLKGDYELVPEGVVYRIVPKASNVDMAQAIVRSERLWMNYKLRGVYNVPKEADRLTREIPECYAVFQVSLADLELKQRMFSRAEGNFKKALAVNDSFVRARKGLGIALACQGKYDEAVEEWRRVLRQDPHDKSALQGLAVVEKVTRR